MTGVGELPPVPQSSLLVRVGLLTRNGEVAGVDGPHPDAELLKAVDRFEFLDERAGRLWRKACEYSEKGKRHKEIRESAFAYRDEKQQLEAKIASTPATTIIGAAAKISVAIAVIDPTGEGISKIGTLYQLPLIALIEAKRVLGGDA